MSSFCLQLNSTGHECLRDVLSGEACCSACCTISDKINPFEHSLIYWASTDQEKCHELGQIVAQATNSSTFFSDALIKQVAFCVGHNEKNDHKRKSVRTIEPVVTMLITCDPAVAMESPTWNPTEQGFVDPPSRWNVSVNCPNISRTLINHLIRGTSKFEHLQHIAKDSSSSICVTTPMHCPTHKANAAKAKALAGEAEVQLCHYLCTLLQDGFVNEDSNNQALCCFSEFASKATKVYQKTIKCRTANSICHQPVPRCTDTYVFILDVLTCFSELLPTLALLSATKDFQWSSLMHASYMEVCGRIPLSAAVLPRRVETIRQLVSALSAHDKQAAMRILSTLQWTHAPSATGDHLYVFEPLLTGIQKRASSSFDDWQPVTNCVIHKDKIAFQTLSSAKTIYCDVRYYNAFFTSCKPRETKLRRMLCRVLFPPPIEFEEQRNGQKSYEPQLY